jgi:hypothetical protein
MAKSDSFFIRITSNGGQAAGFNQETLDLGAYVDALGKSVLRIHNIAVSMTDSDGRSPDMDANSIAASQFQLTTQSQTDFVLPTNKSVVASGLVNCERNLGGTGVAGITSESFDNLPQLWTNGYLIAVDAMYLGASATGGFADDVYCTLVLECTVESMSQAAAMALALSQQ